MMFEEVKETLSGIQDEKIGDLVLFAVESSSAEEVGRNLKALVESFDNEDQLQVLQSVIKAVAGQTLDELIEEDNMI